MDYTYLAYMSLFLALFANELDLFSGSGADDEAEDPHQLYVPEDFSAEIAGTAGGDLLAPEEGEENLAWLLGDGNDSLTGSDAADYADGEGGDDRLFLEDGDDIAVGMAGNDVIAGGAGNDSMLGGEGEDSLAGDAGNDAMGGEAGNDTLTGGAGADAMGGGEGDDWLFGYDRAGSQAEGTTAVDGFDTLAGGAGNDTLMLGLGDRGIGGEGDDLFQIDNRLEGTGQISQITDFADGDRIELLYRPEFDADGNEIAPEVTVTANSEGTAGIIRVGDVTVGEVLGGQGLSAEDITLVREEDEA
ncbi:MAG: calcium-binding protein [Gemmobacter sp.]|uniref:calcium-binding protein n=1 Tax=Gemmobacter sp. TaxID=1898957 RepID=UPI001A498EB2|nr:calcium-binding protein [Gemmobacter sp.]MBL8563365.1 calcium-binding protein [Gemmobacter sp.]